MIKDYGPFRFYKVANDEGSICISLKAFDNYSFGWEYGYSDPARGVTKPWLNIRIGKLNVFYFETWRWGFELWVLGFWIIL